MTAINLFSAEFGQSNSDNTKQKPVSSIVAVEGEENHENEFSIDSRFQSSIKFHNQTATVLLALNVTFHNERTSATVALSRWVCGLKHISDILSVRDRR